MIREIVRSTDLKLRTASKKVHKIDKKVLSIIEDLKDTLNAQKDPEGVGLAGPQIGKNVRVFLMDHQGKEKVIINPEILSISKETNAPKKLAGKHKKIMEGCLSLPNFYTPLERPFSLNLKYLDEKGQEKKESFQGVDAQIVQHEIDHLDGILFVDRMLEQKKRLYEYSKGEWSEVEL